MEKNVLTRLKRRTALVFLLAFVLLNGVIHYTLSKQADSYRERAVYTAEATVRRLAAQLDKYLVSSDLLKHIIVDDRTLSDDEFSDLCAMFPYDDGVIKAYELAPDGIVRQIYPYAGNESAMGLDMLTHPDRKKEAALAKVTGNYTIGGPFPLVQGGTGALLFDPVYRSDEFWGFSILVLDWDKFIDEVGLYRLEDGGYHFRVWKAGSAEGERISIAHSDDQTLVDPVEVACQVPNDTWYFEIEPDDGWLSPHQLLFGSALALAMAAMLAAGYWHFNLSRYHDAQHAKQIERMAKEAQSANEAKSRFLYNMSHDIRTPMNAIIGFSDLLEKHLDNKPRALDYLGKIRSSSAFLLSLINYVLEMSRIENGKFTLKEEVGSCDALLKSMQTVFEPQVQEKHQTLTCTADITHPYVLCDTTKVGEIFLNIISNAVKYTPDGGHISLAVTELPCEKPGCATYKAVASDDGIGMSAEYLPHIFEEFSREHTSTESRVQGTGLGLPIVKAFVDRMGGTIEVESAVGEGTTFTVVLTFPLADATQVQKAQTPAAAADYSGLAGKRLLLAEDNDLNAEIAMTLLQENGLLVDRAQDGEQCLAMLKAAPEHTYAAILMDIQMPRMDGCAAARAIRALPDSRAQIPILAMTANAYEEDRQRSLAAGMNGHLVKPLDIRLVLAELQKFCGQDCTV